MQVTKDMAKRFRYFEIQGIQDLKESSEKQNTVEVHL